MTNTTGKMFQVTTFGSSHGRALGAVIDGCPANLELNEEDIQKELNKRRPGTSKLTSQRNERDHVEILSGGEVLRGGFGRLGDWPVNQSLNLHQE